VPELAPVDPLADKRRAAAKALERRQKVGI
jgi:hypothetical protein